jgi:hypothetical protein
MLKQLFPFALSILFMNNILPAVAASASEEGYAIASAYDLSDAGFKDSRVKIEMVLHSAAGESVSRHLVLNTLEKNDTDSGDNTLVVFSSPADVRDTALLNHPFIRKPDDQWLYLPSIKRVKRISTSNKSGPFVGSEFAFEDFTSQEVGKYTYEYLRAGEFNGKPVEVVARFPTDENSGYSRQVVYFDVAHKQPLKIEFYDRKQSLLKTLTLTGYRQYNGVWRPDMQNMLNHQTGKSTDLLMSDYEFGVGFKNTDFDSSALMRLH